MYSHVYLKSDTEYEAAHTAYLKREKELKEKYGENNNSIIPDFNKLSQELNRKRGELIRESLRKIEITNHIIKYNNENYYICFLYFDLLPNEIADLQKKGYGVLKYSNTILNKKTVEKQYFARYIICWKVGD